MKKVYLLLSLVALCLSSCFEDKGNYTYQNVDDIVIEGIAESYSNLSFAGEVLEIDPVIKTNYTDLQYEWYMWDPTIEENYSGWDEEQNYKAELIGTEKKLSYKVNCPAKRYTIMLKVTSKENGYSVSASTRFDATTEFARGFYILKETPDGNSELDLYYREGEPVMSDLLTAKGYGPLKGKPLCLGALPSHGYITEEDIANRKVHVGQSGFFKYPKEKLQYAPVEKKLNVLWLAIDTLRYDAFTKDIMPNAYAFSEGGYVFNDHYSSSNSTRGGIFGLFYGLPPSYWQVALSAGIPAAIVQATRDNNYALGVFTSATVFLKSPRGNCWLIVLPFFL